jgi:hypothetical protein
VVPGVYEPRSTAGTVLHQVVGTHLDRFLAETAAATDGVGVPRFIEREFCDFLGCGALSRGFSRVRCDTCRFERLVPFSCKARAVCPSCGGRRMAEQPAHLVEDVLPLVPVRQWVLTVPHRLRYRLAFDHVLCRAVLGVFIRAVLGWYRRRGRRAGMTRTDIRELLADVRGAIADVIGHEAAEQGLDRDGNPNRLGRELDEPEALGLESSDELRQRVVTNCVGV